MIRISPHRKGKRLKPSIRLRPVWIAVSIAFTLSLSLPANATVYQYFDEEGTLIVTDNPYNLKKPLAQSSIRPRDIKLAYREDVSYDFYPINAGNFQEAVAAVKTNGPFNQKDKRTYAGETRWNMGWAYKYNSSSRIEGTSLFVSLNIFEIEFRSNIVVLLPELTNTSSLNPHDLQNWDNMMRGLLEHEHDHVRIIKDNSFRDEAQARISAIKELVIDYNPAESTDGAVRNAVEAETARIGHEIIRKIKDRNDEYDRVTEHGTKHSMRSVFFGS